MRALGAATARADASIARRAVRARSAFLKLLTPDVGEQAETVLLGRAIADAELTFTARADLRLLAAHEVARLGADRRLLSECGRPDAGEDGCGPRDRRTGPHALQHAAATDPLPRLLTKAFVAPVPLTHLVPTSTPASGSVLPV
jgi:hypothetical protein